MPICEQCGTHFDGRPHAKTCGAKCRKAASRKSKTVTPAQPAIGHTSRKKKKQKKGWSVVNRYDIEGDTIVVRHVKRTDSKYDYPLSDSPKTNPEIKFMRYPDGSMSEWTETGWKTVTRGDDMYWISGRGRKLHIEE